jgi:tetratricopeptide (TPR) repeat protein
VATTPARIPLDSNALAVLPFRATGASTDVAWLGEGMVDLLSIALDGFAGWRTVHPRTVLARLGSGRATGDVAAAARTAREAGAATMVLGSAVAVGPQLRLHAELYDAVGLRRLAAVDASGSLASPGPVVDSVAVGLARERLGRSGLAGRRAPHEYATTSPQALRAYLAAEQLARGGQLVAAAESLQRAIAIDSAFGLAYYRLYVIASFGGAPPGAGRFALPRTIRAALQRGQHLPQRQRDLLATVDLQQRGLVADALRRADELGRRYPDDAEAAYAEGESYYHLGIFVGEPRERALAAYERGVQLDPGLLDNYNHAIELRAMLGDTAGAWALLHQALTVAPAYPIAQSLAVALRVGLRGEHPGDVLRDLGVRDSAAIATRAALEAFRAFDADPARAVATADTIAAVMAAPGESRTTRAQFLLARAVARLAQGRFGAADSLLADARALDPTGATTQNTIALRGLVRGIDLAAVRDAARSLAASDDDAARLSAVMVSVWAASLDGDTTAAVAQVRELLPGDLYPEYRDALLATLAGFPALARGDTAAALASLGGLLRIAPYAVVTAPAGARGDPADRLALTLARLERARGDLVSAANRLHFTSFATGLVLHRAEAEELLGQIAEQQGDTTTAVRAYRNFTELWKDADPELQPRVAAARSALARLEGR